MLEDGETDGLTLELGDNDAAIVLPGTDTAAIAEGLFATAFLNMGQTCAALKRLYVHESQVDAVCEQLAAIAARQVLGGGLEPGVTFGPVQNAPQLARVEALVEDARAQGARIGCGGTPPPNGRLLSGRIGHDDTACRAPARKPIFFRPLRQDPGLDT